RYYTPGAVIALGDAVQQGRRGRSTKLFNVALGILAEAEFRLGRWDDAAIHAELAVSLADATDEFIAVVPAHGSAAEIHAARGRFAASAEHIDRVSVFEAVMPGWAVKVRAAMAQAFLAIAKDDRAMLRSAGRILLSEPIRSHVLARREAWQWRVMVAEAQLAGGALEEATETVAGLASEVRSLGLANAVPDLARLTGSLADAHGRHQDALDAYSIDAVAAAAAQSPLAVARLALARGELQVRVGDRPTGIASLEAARTAFAELGAVPFLGRCEAALAATGALTPRDGGPPGLDLSPRQEAVALLVADGMTNKEIASELYVSVKAVEYHLGQIYARTGLRSRRELGARMRAAANHRG
ncbi:MAG: helix-turn-helix transcriptional regulator, partial [Nocardioidaceae bacterium]